jgi:predicted  nucleic acid-binding Zn-ribbon protein
VAVIEGLAQLIELQAIDEALAKAEGELTKLPDARGTCAARREAAEARISEGKATVAGAEGVQRSSETELQDKEALLAKLEQQQHQVKSNDAYAALLREMEEAKEAISVAETQILEAMETIESSGSALGAIESEVAALVAHVSGEEKALDAREKELMGRTDQLRGQRQAAQDGVPPELATEYERIAKRCTPALARVVDELCQGCRMNIPPQLHIELMNATQVHVCPNCRRILIPDGPGN